MDFNFGSDSALIVVDMQNDFITGSLGSKEAETIVPRVKSLVEAAYSKAMKVVFTRDTHFEDYLSTLEGQKLPVEHCIKNTPGWNISSELDISNAILIDKYTFGFNNWANYLDDVQNIILVGLCTDICVISNALILRALYPNKSIFIDESATAGVSVDSKNAALATARACQIDVKTFIL